MTCPISECQQREGIIIMQVKEESSVSSVVVNYSLWFGNPFTNSLTSGSGVFN